jgi:hypothetical protein
MYLPCQPAAECPAECPECTNQKLQRTGQSQLFRAADERRKQNAERGFCILLFCIVLGKKGLECRIFSASILEKMMEQLLLIFFAIIYCQLFYFD